MKNFEVDRQLKEDTLFVMELDLCALLLMNDQRFTWLVLVPMIPNITELCALDNKVLFQLMIETKAVSLWIQDNYKPDKLNVASIGNIVSQLHVHIVARFKNDSVWPKPVFGQGTAIPYDSEKNQSIIEALKNQLPNFIKNVSKVTQTNIGRENQ